MNDLTAVWDAVYTRLNTDSTLQALLGGSGRIIRGYAPTNTNITGDDGILTIADISALTDYFQADNGRIIITAWSALGQQAVKIQNRVSELLDGWKPALDWTQELKRWNVGDLQFLDADQIYMQRHSYKIAYRRA